MDDLGEDSESEKVKRLERESEIRGEAWQNTLDQTATLAEKRRGEGWDVLDVAAFHADPVSPSMGDDRERFGIVHVIPDNHADELVEYFDENEFSEFQVYGRTVGTYRFQITELLDPDSQSAVLLAAAYEQHRAEGLRTAAQERGVMYTRAKTIDGTSLGVVKHQEYEPFFSEERTERESEDGDVSSA